MKTREGFVANSSSSTYVILGCKFPAHDVDGLKKRNDIESFWDHIMENDNNLVTQYTSGYGKREATYIVGVGESTAEEDYFTGELEFDPGRVLEALKAIGLPDKYPVKLYYGRVFN